MSVLADEHMQSFRDFPDWYNKKTVASIAQAMLKLIEFYHNKETDLLHLECTLPTLAIICLHEATYFNFSPFTKTV